MTQTSIPPPAWRRTIRLPRTLWRELTWAARRRWRRWRWGRHHGMHRQGILRRAWHRTDPHHMVRVLDAARGALSIDLPPAVAPAPGTEVELTGVIGQGRAAWGELRLDDVALEDAVASALGLEIRAPEFPARITVRVLDDDAAESDRETEDGPAAAG